MKNNKAAEICFSAALSIIGAYVFLVGRSFRGNDKYFPMIIGGGLVICAIWTMLEDLSKKRRGKSCIDISKINFIAVGVTSAALFIYIFLFNTIGYVASTILLGISVILGLRYDSIKGAILWPAVFVIAVFALFRLGLKVPLPTLFL